MIEQHIKEWIKHLSTKQVRLGGHSACPFARSAAYSVVEHKGNDIVPINSRNDLIIYVMDDSIAVIELEEIAKHHNMLYKDLVFLPDHKDRQTFINGVQTNNGKYNLILCQRREDLEKAREKLRGTDYYSFWDEEYLNEILNT